MWHSTHCSGPTTFFGSLAAKDVPIMTRMRGAETSLATFGIRLRRGPRSWWGTESRIIHEAHLKLDQELQAAAEVELADRESLTQRISAEALLPSGETVHADDEPAAEGLLIASP